MRRCILSCIFISTLAGCSLFEPQEAAPVVAIGSSKPITNGTHVVQAGESLYEIAWRYGRDYRDIALANKISPPYVIYTGQKISLKEPKQTYAYTANASQPTRAPTLQVEYPKTKRKTASNKITEIEKPIAASQSFQGDWIWPARGKIVKSYSEKGIGLKGIDIAGELDTVVKASGSGKVVYSGTGLRGYGQLVIIKHNDTYLSAYGHNNKLLVKEGDVITKGQPIAQMGRSDTDRVKLHFEIRKNGRPIDPLTLLPGETA
jgi:lipoprotein NlpD